MAAKSGPPSKRARSRAEGLAELEGIEVPDVTQREPQPHISTQAGTFVPSVLISGQVAGTTFLNPQGLPQPAKLLEREVECESTRSSASASKKLHGQALMRMRNCTVIHKPCGLCGSNSSEVDPVWAALEKDKKAVKFRECLDLIDPDNGEMYLGMRHAARCMPHKLC